MSLLFHYPFGILLHMVVLNRLPRGTHIIWSDWKLCNQVFDVLLFKLLKRDDRIPCESRTKLHNLEHNKSRFSYHIYQNKCRFLVLFFLLQPLAHFHFPPASLRIREQRIFHCVVFFPLPLRHTYGPCLRRCVVVIIHRIISFWKFRLIDVEFPLQPKIFKKPLWWNSQ